MALLNDWPYTDYEGNTTEECTISGRDATIFLKEPRIVMSVNDGTSFEERKLAMKRAVSIQPVPVVFKSQCIPLLTYIGGVLTEDGECACGEVSCINHAMVMVGYDDTADPPYWKIRNSWGDSWGEGGYFRIASEPRGVGEWGLFGILAESTIPLQAFGVTDEPSTPPVAPSSPTASPVPEIDPTAAPVRSPSSNTKPVLRWMDALLSTSVSLFLSFFLGLLTVV